MSGFCECGCGGLSPIAMRNFPSRGWIKGKPKRFISGHNSRMEGNPNWINGRNADGKGYIRITVAPRTWVYEHRLVAEEMLGRPLRDGEVVHHIDGDKANNHPDNLLVFANHGEHVRFERAGKRLTEDHRLRISEGLKRMWAARRDAGEQF